MERTICGEQLWGAVEGEEFDHLAMLGGGDRATGREAGIGRGVHPLPAQNDPAGRSQESAVR